jgi:signal transduction histidine kinase
MIAAPALCAVLTTFAGALLVERSRRRRTEHALQTSEAARRSSDHEAQTLAGRLIAGQESERRRIARDLHDNLSQKLALLCIDIESLATGASGRAPLAEAVADLSERVGDIAGDVHRLSHDLHPPKLEMLGLEPTIEGLCCDLTRRCGVQITFRSGGLGRRVPSDVALCLFRIAQETLQNVVKHSGAAAAAVHLRRTRSDIRLHIADDGKGFDLAAKHGTGLGLLNMRERARLAAGRLAIRSTARGTHIVVDLPIEYDVSATDHERVAGESRAPTGMIPQTDWVSGSPHVMAGAPGDVSTPETLAASSTRQPIDRPPADDAMWSEVCLCPPDRPEEETNARMRAKKLATTAVAVAMLMNAMIFSANNVM